MQAVRYSVVVPVYNEEAVIEETCRRLTGVMEKLGEPYEIIFVNDGSRDTTPQKAAALCRGDIRLRLLSFARNFGHQAAITAGMEYAVGDAVIVIDADLQDPPELIPAMVEQWRAGYRVVYGKRLKRKGESVFKKVTAKLFYRVLRVMTDVDIPVDTGDFRLLDRRVCEALQTLPERNRYVRGLVSWVGFSSTAVEYVREERFAGETKYPLRKMLAFAGDALTSFSYKPLRLSIYLGALLTAGCAVYLLAALVLWLAGRAAPGWTLALPLLADGVILLMLGVVGAYLGRLFDEAKRRPLYIVADAVGFEADARSGRR
ncbi:MAG: glycosyltransferase family 2 protein [Oscillospiraceae bacterium]|jgi:dolichol-phosphate mannosyltransferase|nr:glycosyltransferase family 2 protein [Oscillospiraceae bacterium]